MARQIGLGLWSALVLAIAATPALADRIDGTWCFAQSHFTIDGSRLTIGGQTIDGAYSRHSFAYRVPAGMPDAGADISMILRNEDELDLNRPGAAPEAWRRCRPTS